MTKDETAALVIIYNPLPEVIDNINTYAGQTGKVFVYDNSEKTSVLIVNDIKKIPNAEYIENCENRGLSVPINEIALRALEEGRKALITFDQDSRAGKNMIENMLSFYNSYPNQEEIGLIGPLINDGKTAFGIPQTEFSYYDKIIQSGAFHILKAWEQIGGYDENLFIDQVDFEYCARILEYKFKIIRINNAMLIHNIEDEESVVKYERGKKLTLRKYSNYRYYYIVRNNLYCYQRYRKKNKQYAAENKRNIEVMFQSLRYEGNKTEKFKAIAMAYIDYWSGRMGKLKRRF